MENNAQFRRELTSHIPALRAYALSLARNGWGADDLVQDALIRAWEYRAQFAEGSNFKAWIFTILRNKFYTDHRKRSREMLCDQSFFEGHLHQKADQLAVLDMEDFRRALLALPQGFQEALLLVGASGFSIEEAAQICGVPSGTIKSRLNRARRALQEFAFEETPLFISLQNSSQLSANSQL